MTRRMTARRRVAVAYYVLRGRPVRYGRGDSVLMPLLAAAGGALIGWSLEALVTRNHAAQPVTATDTVPSRPEPVRA